MENTGASRNRTLTIAGKSFTINQASTIGPPPNQPPVARFTAVPIQGQTPLEVTLDARGSYDPDGTIVNYVWIINQQFLSGQIASTIFMAEGEYPITLIVTDNAGATASSEQSILVVETAEIAFVETQAVYNVGDLVTLELIETEAGFRLSPVDLWVALAMPDQTFWFMTSSPFTPFSLEPQAFKWSLDSSKRAHQVFTFEVPYGLGGEYIWYALYVEEGKNPLTDNFFEVIRSNLVIEIMTLKDQ
ncbi:PKD domain protein [Candidatus Thiomargarita nelsonii]|uniref:PKD domain protein n=1 Tax=Candidatus Thiomargarita nelsonii TaxID=1003181 RepID=A0A176S0U3_9GAMM|nr:PKD domain protein [Candidatus Thiomargarita nelsonii]